jgi:hypothetical protein
MSRPFSLPPREPDDRRANGTVAERFAKQAPVNFLELIDSLERRIQALENRLSRTFVDGG